MTLRIDNKFAISLEDNPIAHGRSKVMEMRFHDLSEQVSKENLSPVHCKSESKLHICQLNLMTNVELIE